LKFTFVRVRARGSADLIAVS